MFFFTIENYTNAYEIDKVQMQYYTYTSEFFV